jgi:tellurite resistance protein TehA-like permease
VPYEFHGRYAIGCCFFLFNLVLFTFNVTMISLRFYWYPSTFKASFTHPTESLFVPASVVSCGTVLTNITEYAVGNGRSGYWLERTMIVLFWCYCGVALTFTCGIYLIMWSTQTYTISRMTPGTLDYASSNLRILLTILNSVDLPSLPTTHYRTACWQIVCTSG